MMASMIKRKMTGSKSKSKTSHVGNRMAQETEDYERRTGYWTNAAIAERKAAKAAEEASKKALPERNNGFFSRCRGALCGSRRAKGGRRTRNRKQTRRR